MQIVTEVYRKLLGIFVVVVQTKSCTSVKLSRKQISLEWVLFFIFTLKTQIRMCSWWITFTKEVYSECTCKLFFYHFTDSGFLICPQHSHLSLSQRNFSYFACPLMPYSEIPEFKFSKSVHLNKYRVSEGSAAANC